MPTLSRSIVLAALLGSITAGETRAEDKKLDPDETVKAFVVHLARNDIKLELDKSKLYWVVTDPKWDGIELVVYFRSFPAGTEEQKMIDVLKTINLYFMLNAPTRLAMSHPGIRRVDPTKPLPKKDEYPVGEKIEKLFKAYKPESTDPPKKP